MSSQHISSEPTGSSYVSDESSSDQMDDDLGHALDQYEIMRENRKEVKDLMLDIQSEFSNMSLKKGGANNVNEDEIKQLVDAQEKKSNRFIQSLRLPKKEKAKIEAVKIQPYIATTNQTAQEYLENMTNAMDYETRKTLRESKMAAFKAKQEPKNEPLAIKQSEEFEYEGGVDDSSTGLKKGKKKKVDFEKKRKGPSEFNTNESDSGMNEGSVQKNQNFDGNYSNMRQVSKMPEYWDDTIDTDLQKFTNNRFNIDPENVQIKQNMTVKGKTLESYKIYIKYRNIKDRNKLEAMAQEADDDKLSKTQLIKQGDLKNLKTLSSFDKQDASIEFIDFMAREYGDLDKTNLKSKVSDMSKSLQIQKQRSDQLLLSSLNDKFGFTIRQNDRVKFWWDLFILVIAIFNSIFIPVSLSFQGINEALNESTAYTIIDIASNVFFLVDIVLSFNTTYYEADGTEIFSKKQIARHYIPRSFLIDFLSSLPIEQILPGSSLKLLNMLKLIRVFRLTGIINKLNIDQEQKSWLRISQIIFNLLIVLHVFACLWHKVTSSANLWIPALDWVHAGQYPTIYRVYGKNDSYQYLVALYYSVLYVGGNEMGPRTDEEIIICTCILVFMAMYNATVFGDMAVLTEESGKKQAKFQQQIDVANTAMKQMELPQLLQQEVQSFLLFTLGTKFEQDDQKDFLHMISPSLNEKVSIEIFSRVIQNNRIFKAVFKKKQQEYKQTMAFNASMQDVISLMIHKFDTELVEPEKVIFEQFEAVGKNNENIYFYLIAKGAVDVFIVDQKKKEKMVDTMRNGEFFGEISMIYGCKRTATIKSAKYSTLAKLNKKNYQDILLEFPDLNDHLKSFIYKYDDRMKNFIMKSIQQVEYFKEIGEEALHDIMYNLTVQKFSKGDILQRPGENSTNLYFLQDGVIEIFTNMENGQEFIFEKLFRGSIVNYRTFFMDYPGKVFYRFAKASILSVINYETLLTLCKDNALLNKKFSKFKHDQEIKDKIIPLDYIMTLPTHLIEANPNVDPTRLSQAYRLENQFKNVAIRRLEEIRSIKSKPSLKDMISSYLKKQEEKNQRGRIRIKEQVLQIYEEKSMKQFHEKDPMFNKIIVHIQRVIKIMKAQTQAIDSLQRKIIDLTKKNVVSKNELKIVDQKERIQTLLKQREDEKIQRGESNGDQIGIENEEGKDNKFADIFKDKIVEDNIGSSDDDVEEKEKNLRLERLGRSIKQMIQVQGGQSESQSRSQPSVNNIDEEPEQDLDDREINIGQNGDIINRYRIPIENNEVDIALQLPQDSDSSRSSNEGKDVGLVEIPSRQNSEQKE